MSATPFTGRSSRKPLPTVGRACALARPGSAQPPSCSRLSSSFIPGEHHAACVSPAIEKPPRTRSALGLPETPQHNQAAGRWRHGKPALARCTHLLSPCHCAGPVAAPCSAAGGARVCSGPLAGSRSFKSGRAQAVRSGAGEAHRTPGSHGSSGLTGSSLGWVELCVIFLFLVF